MKKTASFQEICDSVGVSIAKEICQTLGGLNIYVPKEFKNIASNKFLSQLSPEAQKAISCFSSSHVSIPKNLYFDGDDTEKLVIELRQDGFSALDIALMVERSERRVYQILAKARKNGVSLPSPGHAKSLRMKLEALSLHKQGLSLSDISNRIKQDEQTVRDWLPSSPISNGGLTQSKTQAS
jgi:transposase